MSEVVQMLEGKMAIPEAVGSPYNNDVRFKAVKDFHQERRNQSATWSQSQNSTTIRTDAENALHEIAVQLGKKDWDFNLNPCDGNSNWTTPKRNDMPCDLTRNYLSGTIPPEWAVTKLEYMGLESNLFNGMVPAELGKLTNLVNLILSANNLTGELPMELNNLKKLTELAAGQWFEGPIPSSISVLKNLSEL
ncbi:UNVERIFIED_CONTAM: putative LRR receptor-like serine/threonine-protein kinase, partial [Sesamum radiatum]